jgi:hypothetical protein
MNAEGWKSVAQVAEETALSLSRIRGMIAEKKIETTKKKVFVGGIRREISFVRPKVAASL